jgi:hypothetical protein
MLDVRRCRTPSILTNTRCIGILPSNVMALMNPKRMPELGLEDLDMVVRVYV